MFLSIRKKNNSAEWKLSCCSKSTDPRNNCLNQAVKVLAHKAKTGSKLILSIKLPTSSSSQVWSFVLCFFKAAERDSILRLRERTFFFLYSFNGYEQICFSVSVPLNRPVAWWDMDANQILQTPPPKKKHSNESNEKNQDLNQKEGRMKSIFRRTCMALLSRLTYHGWANITVAVWRDCALINRTQWHICCPFHLLCREAEEAIHVSNLPN